MLGKECLCEVNKVCNNSVVTICPIGSELKAIGSFLTVLFAGAVVLLDMARSGGIGIIFRECAIGDDKNLHILIKSRTCPEAVSLIAIDLVESFLDRNPTALQLHMNQRETVHKNGHVISGIVISGPFFILIDDLQTVVMDILFVNQIDVLGPAIFASKVLYIVFLNLASLFHDAFVCVGNLGFEEGFPFFVGEAVLVKALKLLAKVKYKIGFVVNGHVFIALFTKHFDKG